jgi:hypothetical protein
MKFLKKPAIFTQPMHCCLANQAFEPARYLSMWAKYDVNLMNILVVIFLSHSHTSLNTLPS